MSIFDDGSDIRSCALRNKQRGRHNKVLLHELFSIFKIIFEVIENGKVLINYAPLKARHGDLMFFFLPISRIFARRSTKKVQYSTCCILKEFYYACVLQDEREKSVKFVKIKPTPNLLL